MTLFFLLYIFSSFNLFLFLESWKNQLSDFDIIPNIKLRPPRSSDVNRKLYFKTKYKNFHLILRPTQELFTNDFKSSAVDRHGKETSIFIDRNQFYEGFVSGSVKSSVRAFLGSEDTVNINIAVNEDFYQIESLSRYEPSNSSLLVYRFTDLKSNSSKGPLCPSSHLSLPFSNYSEIRNKRSIDMIHFDKKRSTTSDNIKKFCTIKLVADYRFYREHGKGDVARTHNYLITVLDNINQLFKNTEFMDTYNNKYIGYGFLIKEIVVHTEWTIDNPGHYNAQKSEEPDAWKCEDLLNSFGYHDYSDVCLAHLFTYQSFTEGTLGLGWIGTWKFIAEHGGICSSRSYADRRGPKSVNTAWSTYKDAASNHLISMSAYLVTAHELGHNWGADHDPDSKGCSPNANGGGKYVMYTYSVVGYEINNRVFSPCSRRSMGETIRTRGTSCFQNSEGGPISYCGNQRVERFEQCDVGKNVNDICCTDTCQFHPGMQCSPLNHECCNNECKIKSAQDICANADPSNPCLGDARCDGFNRTCLPPQPLSGPKCTEEGKCVNGRCRPFCETHNLEACICDKIEETCFICCRNRSKGSNTNKECLPATKFFSNNGLDNFLNDGRPCTQGFCVQGVCKRKVSKLIERIWKMIDNLDTNLFVAFLLDNLVGVVVLFSLLLWIPASIIVSCHDARYRKLIRNERNARRQPVTPSTNF